MAAVLERARWTQKPGCRVGLLVLERKRDGFDIGWGTKTRARCESALAAVCAAGGHSWVSLNDGAVRVADDRTLRAALAQAAVEVDVLVATQPTISDGRLAAIVAQAYGGPVVLWATPENPDVRGSVVGGVSSNSLVGTHLFAATMRQLGRKDVDLVYADQDWAAAEAQLAAAVNRAYAAKTLRVAKVGLIGHQAPGFVDLHPDPFCLHKTFGGAVLEHVALDDLIARAKALDAATVAADMGLAMPGGFANGALAVDEKSSRLYLALKAIVDDENLDAVAIRCWPELPRDYGQWPYLAVTRLADAGFPVACEGDVATPASRGVGRDVFSDGRARGSRRSTAR